MQQSVERQRSIAFLDEQLRVIDQKRTRLQHALETCGDCLEGQGLRASLANVELERTVVLTLIGDQSRPAAVSLDALILQKLNCLRLTMERTNVWHVGQRTPPAYWEAEVKRGVLTHLLTLYHALEATHRPLPAGSNGTNGAAARAYPWYHEPDAAEAVEGDHPAESVALEAQIQTILARAQYPPEHLEIIIQPDEPLILMGYAHSEDIRECLLGLLLDLDGVENIVSDIQVVQPQHCPICLAQRDAPSMPSAYGHNWLHRRLIRLIGRNGHTGRNGQHGRNGQSSDD